MKSNMPKAPRPASSRKAETIRFGGVPTSVVMPPRMVPKASGISTCPGASPMRPASCTATGISSAIAPTLFMKPESRAPSPVRAARLAARPASAGSTLRASASTAPEACKAALSTSTAATVITAGWPKPAKAASGATSPQSTQAMRPAIATTS